jgi:hypothetical protein
MENTPISQPKNNKLTITLSVLIILLVIVGGVGMFLMIQQNNHQQQEIKNLKTQIENSAKKSENKPAETDNSQTVKKLTWKSEITNLKFDYPESWTLGKKNEELFPDRHTVVLSKNGKETYFEEDESGFGAGPCDDQTFIQFKRHARIMNNTLSVVEESGSQNRIYVSTDTDLKDGMVKFCDTVMDSVILPKDQNDTWGGIYSGSRKPRVSFYYNGDSSNITVEEKAEIIEILSSLSLK